MKNVFPVGLGDDPSGRVGEPCLRTVLPTAVPNFVDVVGLAAAATVAAVSRAVSTVTVSRPSFPGRLLASGKPIMAVFTLRSMATSLGSVGTRGWKLRTWCVPFHVTSEATLLPTDPMDTMLPSTLEPPGGAATEPGASRDIPSDVKYLLE